MKARISTLARKVEELEGKRPHDVQAVTEMHQLSAHCPPRRTLSECSLSEGFDVRTCQCRRSIQDTT